MTIESTEQSELANEGDFSDAAAMDLLAAKRQPQEDADTADEDDEQEEVAEDAAEETEEVEDDDPEYDLGDVKAKKSEILAWKAGEMKDADYRRKTAAAAEVTRAAEARQTAIEQERSHYANHLDVVLQSLQSQLVGDQSELAKLAQTDPAQWVAKNAEFQQRYADYQRAVQERQSLAGRQTADQEAKHQDWVKTEKAALKDKLPEWDDPNVAGPEQKMIAEYLLGQGYAMEEVQMLQDHRALLIARDAAKYRQLQAAKAKRPKPEPGKPLKPGAASNQSPSSNAYEDAVSRVRRTGSEDDAMRLLAAKRKRN